MDYRAILQGWMIRANPLQYDLKVSIHYAFIRKEDSPMTYPFAQFPHGLKIAAQAPPEPSDQDLEFIQQLGVDNVVLWTGGDKAGYEYYSSRRQLYEAAGIKVYGFGSYSVHNQDAIV